MLATASVDAKLYQVCERGNRFEFYQVSRYVRGRELSRVGWHFLACCIASSISVLLPSLLALCAYLAISFTRVTTHTF